MTLPDRPRAARKAPIGTKAPTGTPTGTPTATATAAQSGTPSAKPAWSPVGTSPRKRLTLPLRPVQSLAPRPSVAKPALRGRELPCGATAFVSAAEAWLWTVGALAARHGIRQSSVGRGNGGRTRIKIQRPCDPDDIIRALDLLHQSGGITLDHARVLRRWGDRGREPDATRAGQEADAVQWTAAMTRLEVLLRAKTIVATI